VRKLAAREGVDLAQVHGTGVGGRIRREDVLSAKPAPLPPVADGTQSSDAESEVRLSRLRSMTAERALNDRPVIAQLTSVTQVDVTDINELVAHAQERFSTREGIALTAVPFIALAVIEGLKANPDLNAAIVGNEVVHNPKENLGLTVDTPLGPVVAVVADAGSLGLVGLARGIAAVTGRVLGGALLPTDLVGGTFTLTNPGAGQVLFDSPIVTEPQVAILSVGAAIKRPVVINDAIAIRQMMYLALSYDSRLIDSTTAGRFLAGIKERLEGGHFETELGL
jgi:2-oxoglutarate dehydrogenase E2 component (dihydrolipoamide succinyltransferase)